MGVTKLDVSAKPKKKKTSKRKGTEAVEVPKKKEKLETPKAAEARKKKEKRRKRKAAKLAESTELAIKHNQELLVGDVIGATNTEQEYMEEYRNMFTSLQQLKANYEGMMGDKPQSKDVYALMSMYSQMRECINDMRLINDSGQQAEQLIQAALEPFTKAIGEAMVKTYYKNMSAIRESAPESQVEDLMVKIKEITAETSMDVQKAYETAKERICQELAPAGK